MCETLDIEFAKFGLKLDFKSNMNRGLIMGQHLACSYWLVPVRADNPPDRLLSHWISIRSDGRRCVPIRIERGGSGVSRPNVGRRAQLEQARAARGVPGASEGEGGREG